MPTNSKEYVRKNYGRRFWGTKKAIDKVKARVQARRIMVKKGLVKNGDKTMEVDHIKGTESGNGDSNLRVISRLKNRIAGQKKAMVGRTHKYNKD